MKQLIYQIGILVLFSFETMSQTVVFEENFDAGISASFVMYNRDGYTPHASVSEYTNAWISKEDPTDVSNTVASSTSYFDQPGMADRWLVTPAISLGQFGNYLSWSAKSHDASFAEGYLVLLSTTDTAVESFVDTLTAVSFEDVYWTNHVVNLSEKGYNDQSVYVAFVLRSLDGYKFYLDSIKTVVEDPVGIQHNDPLVAVKLFPNPVVDELHVQADVLIQQVVIRDVNGSEVLRTQQMLVPVQHLSSGVYFVELQHEKGVTARKIVKN